MKAPDTKRVVERQREKFRLVIDKALEDIGEIEGTVVALDTYLRGHIPLIRYGIKKAKHVFGPDTWRVLKTEEIMAFLTKQILKETDARLLFLFPVARDWLTDNGFDQEGMVGRTILDDLEL